MIYTMIAPKWATHLRPSTIEGEFTTEEVLEFNKKFYNCYYFPNSTSNYASIPINPESKLRRKRFIKASDIDMFDYCFVDLDMKDYQSDNKDRSHNYPTKQDFIDHVLASKIPPTNIVDSGNGIHVYWKVSDLDGMSYLRLTRRLCRYFNTDPSSCNIKQLLRVPGTVNTKKEDNYVLCESVYTDLNAVYDSDTLNRLLPPITNEIEEWCQQHYNRAYSIDDESIKITEELPKAFSKLCRERKEVRELFYGEQKDRSASDFRLAHMMFANGISKDDMLSVLFNTDKATERSKLHRYNYAKNIVDKVWEDEVANTAKPGKFMSVKDILQAGDLEHERIHCHPLIDATHHGFRLTQVCGLVAGTGVGKTTVGLNMVVWFCEANKNKDFVHVLISLEQTEQEVALRWDTMSRTLKVEHPDIDWDSKLYILGNYNSDGSRKNLGFDEIEAYVLGLEKDIGKKVGAVIIDHLGLIKQTKGIGQYDGLQGNCERMKSFAIKTKVFCLVQSQTSRSKAGIGDIELDVDAAFGSAALEWNSDFIVVLWTPLKRIIDRAKHMTVTAFKFAKIRKKNPLLDRIKPDVCYGLMYDPTTELLREMTSDEVTTFEFWNAQANKIRNKDKKREPAPLKRTTYIEEEIK